MISEPQTASLFVREQFRMTRLQVYNWGTFSGLHDVPISERGFLFVGRSGAGKSTLLKAVAGLVRPRAGTIHLGGTPIHGLRPREIARHGVAFVPQEANVFPSLTIQENLEMGG